MAPGNCTTVTGFIFRGITDNSKLQNIVFVFFFAVYFCTLVGNVGMILLIRVDSQLHSSMYFFLSHLSLLDVVYSSVIAPKAMVSSLVKSKDISFPGCVVQFFLFSFCANNEFCLLAVMAYDRFMAICKPLLYNVIMSKTVCFQLVAGSYLCTCVNATVHTCTIFSLSFGHSNVLDHFFCDIHPLQEISCSDFRINKLVHFTFAAIETIGTILIILISYIYIIFAILRIRSAQSLLHLRLPPDCRFHLIWDPDLYIFKTLIWQLSGLEENGGCVLYPCDPHAEPPDLQPEEQGGEGRPEEDNIPENYFSLYV
ncbi:unnamed protein product, partial [Eretmochelys imbricata]